MKKTVKQWCQEWGISHQTFYALIREGEIRAKKHPLTGRLSYNQQDLERFDAKLKQALAESSGIFQRRGSSRCPKTK